MEKRKQKGKSMTMEDRERLRLQNNLVGQETQHLATVGTENIDMRRLHGRSIPIPPPAVPPESSRNKIPSNPDPTELFDSGIIPPTLPTEPDPLQSQTDQRAMLNVPDTISTPIPPPYQNKNHPYLQDQHS